MKKLKVGLSVFLFVLSCNRSPTQQNTQQAVSNPAAQMQVLLELMQLNPSGDFPPSWNQQVPLCSWERVLCNQDKKVTRLYLGTMHISTIPKDWSAFDPDLISISLNRNQLTSIDGVRFATSTEFIDISVNRIISLQNANLPPNLIALLAGGNPIVSVVGVTWPVTLQKLSLRFCQLTSAAGLPLGAINIDIGYNAIENLSAFPLTQFSGHLHARGNNIHSIQGVDFNAPSPQRYKLPLTFDVGRNPLLNMDGMIFPTDLTTGLSLRLDHTPIFSLPANFPQTINLAIKNPGSAFSMDLSSTPLRNILNAKLPCNNAQTVVGGSLLFMDTTIPASDMLLLNRSYKGRNCYYDITYKDGSGNIAVIR